MKKSRRHLALLSVLMLTPYLMAASKYSPTETYRDLSFTVEEITPEDYEYGKLYEFNLTNTGKGYISYHEFFYYKADGFGKATFQPYYLNESILKNTLLIAPNGQFKIRYSTNNSTSEFTAFERGSFYTYAYVNSEFSYDEPVNIIKANDKNTYLIDYNMTDLLSLRDYDYHFAVTINYDEQQYCLLCKLGQDDKISFETEDEFDPSKVEIVNIERFRNDVYNGPNYAGLAIGGAFYILIQMAIGGFILFNLIFIPILIHRIIRKKEMNKKE